MVDDRDEVKFILRESVRMIQVTREEWDRISDDYKGEWTRELKENGWQPDLPEEYIGRRTVMSGCISDELGSLLTEGIHFEIVEN